MQLTPEMVRHVARLSRLPVDDDEIAGLAAKMQAVLDLAERLSAPDLADAEPLAHPGDPVAMLRTDEVTEGDRREALQAGAPSVAEGHYLVPQVIE